MSFPHLVTLRFSVGKLPGWAKTKLAGEEAAQAVGPTKPKSRWAERGEFLPFQPPMEGDSSLEGGFPSPRPLLVGEDETSQSELEHSLSPHPASRAEAGFKRPDTLDSFNDADVDDYSTQDDGGESTEPENTGNTLYFGQQDDAAGEYMVNAMDVEELRRSQRRYRAGRGARGRSEAGSDEEEEECSTPSAENSDRGVANNLCVR